VSSTLAVFGSVLRNRDLRRVEAAYVGFNVIEYATWVAMLVFAYRHGGATAASVVVAVQLLPAAIFAPFAAVMTDRYRPVRVLTAGYAAQAAAMAATAAAIMAAAPAPVAYVCAALAATLITITRPTQAALTPALARSPEELTATNVVSGWVENGGILGATAATGLLLALSGPGLVFALCAAIGAVAALLAATVHGPAGLAATDGERASPMAECMAGFHAVARHSGARLVVGLLGVEFIIIGALDILFVVLALEVLQVGAGWVGYLYAAFAAGGVLGSGLALLLVGRRRLAPAIIAAMVVWGVAFVFIAAAPELVLAVLLLALGGAARAILDVAARTLLQRITPADVLGRVFGVLEGIQMAALAAGALVVPLLIAVGGATAALIGVGLLLPLAILLLAGRLITTDAAARVPIVEIALLRSVRLFASLPAPAVEGIARALEPVVADAGQVIIRQGDLGDRYYVVADGEVDVLHDGQRVARLGRAEGFGEIALLQEVPRTATVTSVSAVRLYALEKEPFLTAVTGHAPATRAAEGQISERRAALAQAVRPARSDHPPDRGDRPDRQRFAPDNRAGVGRVDDGAVADVDTDVAAAFKKDEIAGSDRTARDDAAAADHGVG
jgi:CRP-like cAMP-binding protein